MTMQRVTSSAICFLAALVIGCSADDEKLNILDAAKIYESNDEFFASIRGDYPGPYTEFVRIPARDPAKRSRRNELFLQSLRKNFPVEFIDFLPLSESGKDEIDVVLKRYSLGAKYNVVSLIYSEIELPPPQGKPNIALFDQCDERALGWFEKGHDEGPVSAFCRVDQFWYAYQRIH